MSAASVGGELLRGAAIREAAVGTLRAQPQAIEALHYRGWYRLVRRAGYTVAGADPLAVFLTQLTRSPVVRRSTQAGVYAVDLAAPQRLRAELDLLERELRETAAARSNASDLASVRARRRKIELLIDRRDRELEQALRALAPAELGGVRPAPNRTQPEREARIPGQPRADPSSTLNNQEPLDAQS